MKKCIELATGCESEDPLGLSGFISWQRLEKELRKAGEFHEGETVTHFVITDRGIDIRYK